MSSNRRERGVPSSAQTTGETGIGRDGGLMTPSRTAGRPEMQEGPPLWGGPSRTSSKEEAYWLVGAAEAAEVAMAASEAAEVAAVAASEAAAAASEAAAVASEAAASAEA